MTAALLVAYGPLLTYSQALEESDSGSNGVEPITGTGEWTLAQLGYGDTSIDIAGSRTSVQFSYAAAAGAHQGPETWWHLRLRFRIQFARRLTQPVFLSASTQGRTTAQVEFDPDPVDPSRVMWKSLTLTGKADGSAPWADATEVQTQNYLQYEGVGGGSNKLEVLLEQPADSVVMSVAVLATTALVVDNNGPFDLSLKVPLSKRRVHAGDIFELPYVLTNTDALPARDVKLRVNLLGQGGIRFQDGSSPEPAGNREKSVFVGDVNASARGTIRIRADKAGTYDVVVTAAGSGLNDRDAVRVRAVVYGRGGIPNLGVFLLLLIVVTGAAMYHLSSRTERRTGDEIASDNGTADQS